jgi:hypothetical protein
MAAITGVVQAAPITGVVVERIGGDAQFGGIPAPQTDGSAAPVFLDQFSAVDGSRTQTIALPTVANGSQQAVTEYYGIDTFNGYFNKTTDGSALVTTGYNAAPDTASVISGAPARRPMAIISTADGSVDTATSYRWSSSTSQRSVASTDAGNFYIVTASGAQGTRYVAGTGTTPQQTPAASAGRIVMNSHRTVRIFDNKLFMSSGSVTVGPGLAMIDPDGTGLPTSSASTDPDFSLPTLNFAQTTATPGPAGNPEQFVLLNLNGNGFHGTNLDTAYIADGDLGLQKWTVDANDNWTLVYTNNSSGGLEGLDYAGLDASGNPIFYATNVGDGVSGNSLFRLVDTGASASFETLANSPANTYFRGVAVVPEPGSCCLLGVAGLAFMRRRHRKI